MSLTEIINGHLIINMVNFTFSIQYFLEEDLAQQVRGVWKTMLDRHGLQNELIQNYITVHDL